MKKEKSQAIIILKPSKIQGIGCFALEGIENDNIVVNLWDKNDNKFFSSRASGKIRQELLDNYCIETEKGYWCPKDFKKMSVGWYLNHSKRPNLKTDNGLDFYATRYINTGTELTIDYRELDEDVDNSDFDYYSL